MARILLAEDDPMNLDMLRRYLTLEGHAVVSVTDGRRAVELARQVLPDLIILDMGLPVMDGWQAVAALKAAPDTRATPVIALTAYAMSEDRARCLAAGCDDYATKPVEFRQLAMRIKALLERGPLSQA